MSKQYTIVLGNAILDQTKKTGQQKQTLPAHIP